MASYQTRMYKAALADFELGWQLIPEIVIFESKEYENPTSAILEFDFNEPSEHNWFASMIERIDSQVTDEEIFDSSVVDVEYQELDLF